MVQISWHLTVEMSTKQHACFSKHCVYRKARFFGKNSQSGRWAQLFSPYSFNAVFAEELKINRVFMFETPDFSLAPCLCKQADLDLFMHEKISIPVSLYRGLYGRHSPLWHYCSLRCALHWSHLNILSSSRSHLLHGPRSGFCRQCFWPVALSLSSFNPIQTRLFLGSKNQGGGGGTLCPLPKTLLPFSESIQENFFWKLVQKWISWHNFGFHGNHG